MPCTRTLLTGVADSPPGLVPANTKYPLIAVPAAWGAVHVRVTRPRPGLAATEVGAPRVTGVARPTKADATAETGPIPRALTAATLKYHMSPSGWPLST